MSKYMMQCPQHKIYMEEEEIKENINIEGPLYYFDKCKQYYVYNPSIKSGRKRFTKHMYNEIPIFYISNSKELYNDIGVYEEIKKESTINFKKLQQVIQEYKFGLRHWI